MAYCIDNIGQINELSSGISRPHVYESVTETTKESRPNSMGDISLFRLKQEVMFVPRETDHYPDPTTMSSAVKIEPGGSATEQYSFSNGLQDESRTDPAFDDVLPAHSAPTTHKRSDSTRKRKHRTAVVKVLDRLATKDVVCLPHEDGDTITIPRGKRRSRLASAGMTGNIVLTRRLSPQAVVDAISAIFRDTFQIKEEDSFDFIFLSGLVGSFKKLQRLNASSDLEWGGAEVISACGQGSLYIMCDAKYGVTSQTFPALFEQTTERHSMDQEDPITSSTNEVTLSTLSNLLAISDTSSPSARTYLTLLKNEEMVFTDNVTNELLPSDYTTAMVDEDTMRTSLQRWYNVQCTVTDDERARIIVRTSHEGEDALRAFNNRAFKSKCPFSVIVVDDCGSYRQVPSRELFTLAIPQIRNRFFCGKQERMVPINKTSPVVDGTFYAVGQLLAAAVLHGNHSLSFLNPIVTEILINQENPKLCISWIPCDSVKTTVQKINDVTEEGELQYLSNNASFHELVADVGWNKSLNITNKLEFVTTACNHYLIFKQKPQLDALVKGMDFYGMKAFAQFYPDCIRNIIGFQSDTHVP
ncbi:uncharacterized protein [Antedon mediterranea]|uniref:uncharacterized protein n=1 Tax=Antedon mediterranea TaxID=105859 RepID=UPI003AF78FF5